MPPTLECTRLVEKQLNVQSVCRCISDISPTAIKLIALPS